MNQHVRLFCFLFLLELHTIYIQRMMTSISDRWKKTGGGRNQFEVEQGRPPCHSSDLSHLDIQGMTSTRLPYLIHNPKLSDGNPECTGTEETEEGWADKYVVV